MTHDASLPQSDTEPWFDLDFVIDYTNNKFKVYHDGTEVGFKRFCRLLLVGLHPGRLAISREHDWLGLDRYELQGCFSDRSYRRSVITTMIDRVALCRPLTDRVDNTNPSPVSAWSCSAPVNGISTADITIWTVPTNKS